MSNQENNLKEIKKTRRRKSQRTIQQMKLAIIMIMVSVLVLSASTFAWYKLNNTADIKNMQFTADTLGNLQIAPTATDESGNTVPGSFDTSLDLALNAEGTVRYLLPATTTDGKVFYSPKYDSTGEIVTGASDTSLTEDTDAFNKYVYKKEFYIKSGTSETNKWYTLKLADATLDNATSSFNGGTYIIDKATGSHTAANAIRVSFVLGEGAYVEAKDDSSGSGTIKIWEAYDSTTTTENGTRATEPENTQGSYGTYSTITQTSDGKLSNGTLCTIKEGVPVKITMYVWIEGYDDDCVNEIALDTIMGQIQFVAESK